MPTEFPYTHNFWTPSKLYRNLEDFAEANRLVTIDVGCGRKKFRGSTGMDERTNSLADVHHDLNVFPYPLPDDTYDIVMCRHVLEHVDNVPGTLEEFYRIAKPGGIVMVEVPHFTHPEAYRHWQHKHFFTNASLDYFKPGNSHYKTALKMVNKHIYIHDLFRATGVEWLMNRCDHFYERHLAFILQASCIVYTMRAVKPLPPPS
ncbi:MAG: class I SAM-dependent methyltransferase [Nitrospirae bacterium]|nr:class I SAM-dependent methyltransferase [Nitrospirota bacterium]